MMGLDKLVDDWPPQAEEMYDEIESLGQGSFGAVWMARRIVPPENEYDDEYVAIKNIEIKEEKSYKYARREITILSELRHPNVIRLIRYFPIWNDTSQLVVMQLARGPNLQYLVRNRGALGLPVARLVARHLIAAVSYLHGRAVLHRDIKPTNCILENTQLHPETVYDWLEDDAIWSDGPDAKEAVASNKWKLMLVDFGFARALEDSDLHSGKRHTRNSIVNESAGIEEIAKLVASELEDEEEVEKWATTLREEVKDESTAEKRLSMVTVPLQDLSVLAEAEDEMASEIPSAPPRPPNGRPSPPDSSSKKQGESSPKSRRHKKSLRARLRRQSSARTQVRSMSALGTKAYAAPEIRHDLRNKTDDDINIPREALTDCVADYGMIVDAYSVGWTLRVVLTGIPPNHSISSYMEKLNAEDGQGEGCCFLCFGSTTEEKDPPNLRDVSELPKEVTHLINAMTKKKADDRMTVREAQSHPYIKGVEGEASYPYKLPEGDLPSKHGDPVVPLKCAESL